MSDIVEFLRARLDEDELFARAATPGPWRHNSDKHWHKPGTAWFEEAVFTGPPGEHAMCVAGTGDSDDPQSMADANFIARHDPARVLIEVEAKRRIVNEHELITVHERPAGPVARGSVDPRFSRRYREFLMCATCLNDDVDYGIDGPEGPCPTLRALAAVYSDHRDYQQEWRP